MHEEILKVVVCVTIVLIMDLKETASAHSAGFLKSTVLFLSRKVFSHSVIEVSQAQPSLKAPCCP